MKEEKKLIGRQLAKARTDKKISLEKASKDTKITQKYLKFIEDEQFNMIPGSVVLKGFIKIYADYLGVDSNALMADLAKKIKNDKNDIPERPKPKTTKIRPEINTDMTMKIMIAACLVVLFIFVGFLAVKYTPNINNPEKDVIKVTEDGTKGTLDIKVHILDKTWLLIESDDVSVFKGVLNAGAEKDISAEEKIFLKIGNAAGVKITSGNKVLLEPGERGHVAIKEFYR